MVHLSRPYAVGTIMATFPDGIKTSAHPAHWAEHLCDRPLLHWRVYVDGAWGISPTPTIEKYFGDGNSLLRGGCIVLMASRAA